MYGEEHKGGLVEELMPDWISAGKTSGPVDLATREKTPATDLLSPT